MLERLEKIKQRYDEISVKLADSAVMSNQEQYRELLREHASLEEPAQKYGEYLKNEKEIEKIELMQDTKDEEIAVMAREELEVLEAKKEELEEELKILLLPKDLNDDKNVILEIRAGTGGEEASLFGMDLLRMYTRYAERSRFKTEPLSTNYTELGGVKEVVMSITGKGAYSRLKYESGVHRVQRVPETESGGRIHTSAATVAVLPEAGDVDITINQSDLRTDVFRSGGHGGQSVNTTDSAVRITHLPTGLVVTCQDEKSQLKNKEKAMKVLKSRLYDMIKTEKEKEYAQSRKKQVGSGDRSERIRTYNFPQSRVTDHRIGLTLYKLPMFLDGDMDEMIDALTNASRKQEMEE